MAKYFPEAPPFTMTEKERELVDYVFRELNRVSVALFTEVYLNLEKKFVEPERPQDGDVSYADGTSWNPGAGVGIYAYVNGSWTKLNVGIADDLSFDTLRLEGTGEASLVSTGHPFQIGPSSAQNLRMDTNEIQSVNNAAAAILDLNPHGGKVTAFGTNTNDNAAAGLIGEIIASTVLVASAVALTSGTSANVTSISLTPGDWDVVGSIGFSPAATTSITREDQSISLTSAALDAAVTTNFTSRIHAAIVPNASLIMSNIYRRVSIAATTTVYLVARGFFTVSTLDAFGQITARRAR